MRRKQRILIRLVRKKDFSTTGHWCMTVRGLLFLLACSCAAEKAEPLNDIRNWLFRALPKEARPGKLWEGVSVLAAALSAGEAPIKVTPRGESVDRKLRAEDRLHYRSEEGSHALPSSVPRRQRRLQDGPCGRGRAANITVEEDVCNGAVVSPDVRDAMDSMRLNDEDPAAAADALDFLRTQDEVDVGTLASEDAALPAWLNLTAVLGPDVAQDTADAAGVVPVDDIETFGVLATAINDVTNETAEEVLFLLPGNASIEILASTNCSTTQQNETTCFCPLDVTGSSCERPREFTCSLEWADAALSDCLRDPARHGGTRRGYRPKEDGDPVCVPIDRKSDSLVELRLRLRCDFNDNAGSQMLCNGSSLNTTVWQEARATAAGEGAPPFFGLPCDEAAFSYTAGISPRFALSAPSSLRLRIRPYNMRHLSDQSAVLELPVRFGEGIDPSQGGARVDDVGESINVTARLHPGDLSDNFFLGGRLYVESFLVDRSWACRVDESCNPLEDDEADSSDALDPMTGMAPFLRLLIDDVSFEEPPRESDFGGGAIAGVVVSAAAVVAALAWGVVRRRRDNMPTTQPEQEHEQEQPVQE